MMRRRLTAGASRGSRRDAPPCVGCAPLDSCDQTKADRTGMVLVRSAFCVCMGRRGYAPTSRAGLVCVSQARRRPSGLLRRECLADHAGEGDGTATAVAGRHVRVGVRVVRARVAAAYVEVLDGAAVGAYGLELLVDSNAVERAQHVARGAHAEEGGGALRSDGLCSYAASSNWEL